MFKIFLCNEYIHLVLLFLQFLAEASNMEYQKQQFASNFHITYPINISLSMPSIISKFTYRTKKEFYGSNFGLRNGINFR